MLSRQSCGTRVSGLIIVIEVAHANLFGLCTLGGTAHESCVMLHALQILQQIHTCSTHCVLHAADMRFMVLTHYFLTHGKLEHFTSMHMHLPQNHMPGYLMHCAHAPDFARESVIECTCKSKLCNLPSDTILLLLLITFCLNCLVRLRAASV